MQIENNSTGMAAGLTVAVDREGRDHCVVAVKGTFTIDAEGRSALAERQEPLVTCDIARGEPGQSSVLYECDFAPVKPRADVIVNGNAVAPAGEPAGEVTVALEVGAHRKEVRVVGDRHWEGGLLGIRASPPVPFVQMPLVFERAFGGTDQSHSDPGNHAAELRNPVGVGFRKNPDPKGLEGTPLPNLEDPRHPLRKWSDTPSPTGLGVVGRGWQPRIGHAGTFDARWQEERAPFLPVDFDCRYFQAAPEDQQLPYFKGGEVVRCERMSVEGLFSFIIPTLELPIVFRFRSQDLGVSPNLDTLIIEPDARRFLLVWRASTPLGRKLTDLREVRVGG